MSKRKTFNPGKDTVWYSRAVYGPKEIAGVVESLRADWLVPGEYSRKFEEKVSKMFGQNFGLFVNSGSSANLLAIESLDLPKCGEVITPACTFSATVNPLLKLGLTPVLVDVEIDTYNIDISLLKKAITSKTVALMIPHLVGNLNDMPKLRRIANKYNLKLIEDSCDTIGTNIGGELTGKYADATTTSFYASHIVTAAGGGGMVMFKTKKEAEKAKVLRDWGRALPEHFDESPDKRFVFSLNNKPHDGKFVFTHKGYNLKPIDLQAAFGLVQLKRLNEFSRIRRRNFKYLYNFFKKYPEHFILPKELPNIKTNWLAYPITIKKGSPIKRVDLMRHLENNKIQTRVLFAGNILRHPAYKKSDFKVYGELKNSDYILENSMLIGCHHGLTKDHIDYIIKTLEKYIGSIKGL
jgi:CDP-4-dehydro-6-deoxyglucose reductase, E1